MIGSSLRGAWKNICTASDEETETRRWFFGTLERTREHLCLLGLEMRITTEPQLATSTANRVEAIPQAELEDALRLADLQGKRRERMTMNHLKGAEYNKKFAKSVRLQLSGGHGPHRRRSEAKGYRRRGSGAWGDH